MMTQRKRRGSKIDYFHEYDLRLLKFKNYMKGVVHTLLIMGLGSAVFFHEEIRQQWDKRTIISILEEEKDAMLAPEPEAMPAPESLKEEVAVNSYSSTYEVVETYDERIERMASEGIIEYPDDYYYEEGADTVSVKSSREMPTSKSSIAYQEYTTEK